jgi:hypothetical protein
MLTAVLIQEQMGQFWRLVVPTGMSQFAAKNRVCRQRFYTLGLYHSYFTTFANYNLLTQSPFLFN